MDHRPTTIGGAPQVLHVFPGGQATAVAVRWGAEGQSGIYLQGRQTFDYEVLDIPLVTFNGLRVDVHAPGHWPEEAVSSQASSDETRAGSLTAESVSDDRRTLSASQGLEPQPSDP